MKFKIEKTSWGTCITKIYELGEKYICALSWNRKDGKPTKELVEAMVPGAKFVKVDYYPCFTPEMTRSTVAVVRVERTYMGSNGMAVHQHI